MSVETELRSFLPTDLFTLVGSTFSVVANNVYFDERSRYKREGTEILLTWGSRPFVARTVGNLVLSSVDIELFVAVKDLISNTARQVDRKLNDTVKLIVDTYDSNIDRFMASGALTFLIDSVRCQESGPFEIVPADTIDPRIRYVQHVRLDILAYES